MPEDTFDRSLEQMLGYPEPDADDSELFVAGVMQQVRKERSTRRVILIVFGVIGALFGVAGATMLSDSISRLFTESLTGEAAMQGVLFVAAAVAFYTWFMNDDLVTGR